MTEGPAPKRGNLRTRVLTALVLGPAVLGLIWLGGLPYAIFLLLLSAVCLSEWLGLLRLKAPSRRRDEIAWAAFLCVLILSFFSWHWAWLAALCGGLMLIAQGWRENKAAALWAAFGIPYIILCIGALLMIRTPANDDSYRLANTLFVFLSVWMTDSCAYFAGRGIGGPRLAPRISPSKTWAGLIGGMAGAALTGYLLAHFCHLATPAWYAATGLGLAVVAQGGDLLESALKRYCGAKDSGTLIPGHGGALDRIDGLLAASLGFACLQTALRLIHRA